MRRVAGRVARDYFLLVNLIDYSEKLEKTKNLKSHKLAHPPKLWEAPS
jgi:hypothetical protein